jgi:hypothetical protein
MRFAGRERSLLSKPAITPAPQPSTPKPPLGGTSLETFRSERMHSWVKAAAYSPPNLSLHSSRFSKRATYSQPWDTSRRSS